MRETGQYRSGPARCFAWKAAPRVIRRNSTYAFTGSSEIGRGPASFDGRGRHSWGVFWRSGGTCGGGGGGSLPRRVTAGTPGGRRAAGPAAPAKVGVWSLSPPFGNARFTNSLTFASRFAARDASSGGTYVRVSWHTKAPVEWNRRPSSIR